MYNKAIVSWIAAILWMATIFLLSHQPANDSSKLSLGVLDFFMQSLSAMMPQVEMHADLLHTVVRKGAHFGAYFILGILMLNGLRQVGGKGVKAAVLALFLCFLYAITDEIHQLFIPGRSGQFTDVLIDTAGAATGIGIFSLVLHLFRKKT
ncbi:MULTISPECIES: VanZ family protein [Shouchella]|uniref:VanZ family protein n=1 Tax=Shouchella rhizosphaerae TaxID=866786 RepID=A0ABZ2CSY5_9BACI|nr:MULTISPECIES: VanZ family protein [Shouchella]MBX0317344.1 VanZ family protein [Shouchella clausii]MDO7269006.1 VanZ family protein [Shouchella clausii]MDO7288777.1 VanZ family protein [Shouchella clausii]PAD16175.1 VanZ family protein [Shouchella clausii]SHL88193.1 VanZ like family protein [Shouchella rhizosphaerae]